MLLIWELNFENHCSKTCSNKRKEGRREGEKIKRTTGWALKELHSIWLFVFP